LIRRGEMRVFATGGAVDIDREEAEGEKAGGVDGWREKSKRGGEGREGDRGGGGGSMLRGRETITCQSAS
jgi:hypothetical protein